MTPGTPGIRPFTVSGEFCRSCKRNNAIPSADGRGVIAEDRELFACLLTMVGTGSWRRQRLVIFILTLSSLPP